MSRSFVTTKVPMEMNLKQVVGILYDSGRRTRLNYPG